MVKKFNLSEAAAEVLNKSISTARAKQEGPSRLPTSVVAGQKEVGDIGTEVTKTTDAGPDATKGVATATPPGATPPVGAEPMKKLKGQPAEAGSVEHPEGKPGRQMMDKNKGATFETYHEETEEDEDNMVAEAEDEGYEDENEEYEQFDEAVDMSDAKSVATHLAKKAISLHGISNPNRAAHHAKNASAIEATINRVKSSSSPSELAKAHTEVGSVSAARRRMNVGRAMSSAEKSAHKSLQSGVVNHLQQHLAQHHAAFRDAAAKFAAKKTSMKEDIDALMQGESLSEEFVQKATTIFEAAVMSRVEEIAEEMEQEYAQQFDSAITELKEDFANKIDDYLNYMVEEWMEENKLAIESGLRSEIVEDFIGGLRNLFAEHYIDIPEEKVDVVEELTQTVEDLEGKLNEQIARSIELKKEINEHKKIQAVQAVCEGLTQTQVEKLKSLAESVEFTSEEDFTEKLNTLKEAYVPSTVKTAEKSALEEGVEVPDDKPAKVSADPLVDAVARTISKSVLK